MICRAFSYWHQGFGDAPPVVQMCTQSLTRHHEQWNVELLDGQNIYKWLEPIPIPQARWERLPLAHQSDVIRTQLLVRHGGVWADPTVWFQRPMDGWLDEALASGLFLYSHPGVDRLVSNWFIAAERENPLLKKLYTRLCFYWSEHDFKSVGKPANLMGSVLSKVLNRNIRWPQLWLKKGIIRLTGHAPYMIYHYLFADLVRTDPECAEIWREMPRYPASSPHSLLRLGLMSEATPAIQQLLGRSGPPLFKLTWKLPSTHPPPGSVLAELSSNTDTSDYEHG